MSVPPGLTFLDLPYCDILARPLDADVVIFGAAEATPLSAGEVSHAAPAPDALRAAVARHAADLSRWDFDQDAPLLDPARCRFRDGGNLETDPARPEQNRRTIRAATAAVLAAGAVPVLLGGDDSVPIPFFAAYDGHGPLTIVQIDAHLDWRDERNGLRETFSSTMRRASEYPWVERIVQVGLRGVGASREADVRAARQWGARLYTAAAVRQHGIEAVLAEIPQGARCVITVDCDGLDPAVMPAVLVPQPGGLLYGDVVALLDGIAARARIVGFDIVELVPDRDVNGIGALTAARLVCVALGHIARQRAGKVR